MNKFNTREEWLGYVTRELRPAFLTVGAPIPKEVRFAVGFTSAGYRSKAIGECHSPSASGDKHAEIFIKPDQDNAVKVAGILAHELVHAAVGVKEGHKGRFRTTCLALGFTRKMTSALPDVGMQREIMDPILKRAGKLPHRRLTTYRLKKQTTRLLKCECNTCGYIARVTLKWIDTMGAPYCGVVKHGRMLCDDFGDEEEGDE